MTTEPVESVKAPPSFHIMLKPRGAICNLDCKYCYFLSKENLYPDSNFVMSDDLLEDFTRQYIEAQQVDEVTFSWQGGEPTLMTLEFFEKAVAYQRQYRKPGMRIQNALQTNGTTLDAEWCRFFRKNNFLVGISIDGPRELHDAYRVDKGNRPTFDRVMLGLDLLKRYGVEFNVLTTVNAANADYPVDVYRFLRDEAGTRFIQFIPIVERVNKTGFQEGNAATFRSVGAKQYGQFLKSVFDEWVQRDVGRIFVQIFDVALAAWLGVRPGLCVFEETCGGALAIEHNGDLYACDHYVEPGYKRGNLVDTSLIELVGNEAQRAFGEVKRDTLPRYCQRCEVRFACNGGCPKNRFIHTPDGEPGLNYLCEGYKMFFNHIDQPMSMMAAELCANRAPANVMLRLQREKADRQNQFSSTPRNSPCPCGSGRKYKHCHGHPSRA